MILEERVGKQILERHGAPDEPGSAGGTFFIFYGIPIYMATAVTKLGYSLASAFEFTSIIAASAFR